MKKLLLFSLSLLIGTLASAIELNYNWQPGKTYTFETKQVDDISTKMNMMGMNQSMKETFTTTSNFSLYITKVDPAGKATGILYLNEFKVIDSKGNVMASMDDIPSKAIVTDITVDRKGHFEFFKRITLLVTAESNILLQGSITENSASASAQGGGMKVAAYAEFDPKTGTLKAGYSVEEVKNTHEVTVTVKQEDNELEVLPYGYLEMLAMPDGDVNTGDKVKMKSGMYTTTVTAESITNQMAVINFKMNTDKTADLDATSVEAKSGDGKQNMNMGMDVDTDMDMGNDHDMDMGGMDMGGTDMGGMEDMMGGMGMGGSEEDMFRQSSPDMTADITCNFNTAEGMFENVEGTMTTKMNTMGLEMEVVSRLGMKLVK